MPDIDKLSQVIQNWLETAHNPTWKNLIESFKYSVIHDAHTAFKIQEYILRPEVNEKYVSY